VIKDLGLDDIELENAYGKTRTPEFLAMNPCHGCPTLELDDGSAIWESNTVMRYICNVSPNGEKLYPADPKQRARVDMVMDWRQCSLGPCISPVGYVIWGMPAKDEDILEKFKTLMDEHFKVLTDAYLKDTDFCFSDTPTIADLSVAPLLTFLKARSKFWDKVPDKVKAYHTRVLEAFPGAKEYFDMLDGMCTSFDGPGADLAPLE
jgi:glutathione S-transferase